MKNYIIKFCMMMFVILAYSQMNTNHIWANQNILDRVETLKESKADYNEIVKLESQIKSQIQIYSDMNNDKEKSNEIKVDFDNGIKIYTDVDIFNETSDKISRIEKVLKNAGIVWDVNAFQGKKKYRIQISKNLPLNLTDEERSMFSKEEIDAYEARVGKWEAVAVEEIQDNAQDYLYVLENEIKKLGNKVSSDDKIVLCGGLTYIGKPAAIIGNKNAEIIIPLGELVVTGDEEQIKDVKVVDRDDSNAYHYDDIKEAVNEMGEPEEGLSGFGNEIVLPKNEKIPYQYIVIPVIIVFIIPIVVIIIRKKRA